MSEMSEGIPKKIYRQVLKGLQFYHVVDGSGCSLNELVSFVFLKNYRIYHPVVVRRWVEDALESFRSCGLLKHDLLENWQLHEAFSNGPFDNEERFVINPNRTRFQDENNSSQESLSTVPYYRKILNRKGNNFILPKHRVHGKFKNLEEQTNNEGPKQNNSKEDDSFLNVSVNKKLNRTSSLHEKIVSGIDQSLETSSDED